MDLPEADRPVNQIVKPFCLRKDSRSAREREGCQVMLLQVLWLVIVFVSLFSMVDLGNWFVPSSIMGYTTSPVCLP